MAVGNIVIVGGGLAGATAAKTLRAEGFSVPMVLVAAESHQPYLRPPLSKEYLLGKAGDDALPVVPEDWYDANDVDLRLGVQVTALDPAARAVVLDDGRRLEYGSLLLATGARPRTIPLPGSGLEGVSTFRTVEDSRRLHARLAGGGLHVVMVGSGWIGMGRAAGRGDRPGPGRLLPRAARGPRGSVQASGVRCRDSGVVWTGDVSGHRF